MIIQVGPLENGSGGGSSALTPVEFEFDPEEGDTIQVPDTKALLINILLWPDSPLDEVTLRLPDGLVAGRRFFVYLATNSITQLSITAEPGVMVANGVASMNENDEIVFNVVSTTRKIIARAAN